MKVLDLIFLARPTLILPGWGFFLLGYLHSLNLMENLKPAIFIPVGLKFWMAFISATLISAYIYVINQIFDVESDKKNSKLFILPNGYISIPEAVIYSAVLLVSSFIFGLFVGVNYLVFLFFGFLIGTFYSLPPFRFKGRPFLDMFSNALGYSVLNLGAGVLAGDGDFVQILKTFPPYFFAVCALYLNTTIPDIPGDKSENLITTGVFLGEFKTSVLAFVMVLITIMLSRDNPFMFWVSLISLPFYLLSALRRGREFYAKVSYRISGLAFTILLITKYPPFLIPSIITLISLRLYYGFRFGINYPSLFGR